MPNFNFNFILGSKNLQASALKDHDTSRCHNQAVCEKEHQKAAVVGRSLSPRNIVQNGHSNTSIAQGIQLLGDFERDTVKKLCEIAYYI